jgi:hypothetical protein
MKIMVPFIVVIVPSYLMGKGSLREERGRRGREGMRGDERGREGTRGDERGREGTRGDERFNMHYY